MSTLQQVNTMVGEDPTPGTSGPSGGLNNGNSRKRARENDDDDLCCIGGCGNPNCNTKKSAASTSETQVRWWYIKLESEDENYDSDTPSSLAEESVYSCQDNETEPVKDSDDEFSLSDGDETRWQAQHRIEFELATDVSSDDERPFGKRRGGGEGGGDGNDSGSTTTCSSDLEAAVAVVAVVASEAQYEIPYAYFADYSSGESTDPELGPQDKWSCLQCGQKNQPIPRYCQQCFAVRKKWFPPRPRHRGQARRRGAARCQAERSQAEARRNQSISLSFPPPGRPQGNLLSMLSQPQPGTSRQDFPFIHPSSQPDPTLPTPPQTDASFSSNSKSSQEDIIRNDNTEINPSLTCSKLDNNVNSNDDLSQKTTILDTSLEENKDTEYSKAESIPDTVILEASDVDSESDDDDDDDEDVVDTGFKFVQSAASFEFEKEVSNFYEKMSKNLSKATNSYKPKNSDTKEATGEDVVDFNVQVSKTPENVASSSNENSHIPDDIVNFCLAMSQSYQDAIDASKKSTRDEDVVDFGHKSTQDSEDVVDFCHKSTQDSEDVVDFCPKSTQDEDVVDFCPKSTKNFNSSAKSSQDEEDVVDFCPKPLQRSQNINFYPKIIPNTVDNNLSSKSTQCSEDVIDFPQNSSQTSLKFNFGQKSTENTYTGSSQNSEDVVDSHQGTKRPLENSLNSCSKLQKTNDVKQEGSISFASQSEMSSVSILGSQSPIINVRSTSPESTIKMCIVCETNPANTAFTHGRFAHQCACYQCAKKIYNAKGRCPICRRAASSFYKIYTI